MFKNIQFKIILIFFLVGIIIISGLGIFSLYSLNNLNSKIQNQEIVELSKASQEISQISTNTTILLIVTCVTFAIIGIVIAIVLSRFVIYPINKLIKSAEKITEEEKTQRNQIETILLHMTDGIIAFNMKGEIILINPAAKKFLSIRPEDNTFEDIFKKFKLDINMEQDKQQYYQAR